MNSQQSENDIERQSVFGTVPTRESISPDDLRFNPPAFGEAEALTCLEKEYGIRGELAPLAGERDQNFRVRGYDGDFFVLKISSPDETPALVDFQIEALSHIYRSDPTLPVPRHIPAQDGRLSTSLVDESGREHIVRLLTYLPGTPLAAGGEVSKDTVFQVGALQGSLCRVLERFEHPAAHHFMPWDSMNGLVVSGSLREYLPPELSERCEPILDHLQQEALPALHGLEAQVIHNDAHTGNVLVDDGNPPDITGVIDFGDMVYRPVVVDLSTSMGSMSECCPDYLGAAASLVQGFESRMTLSREQKELLYDALLARQILTVQLLAFRVRHTEGTQDIQRMDLPGSVRGLVNTLDVGRERFLHAVKGC